MKCTGLQQRKLENILSWSRVKILRCKEILWLEQRLVHRDWACGIQCLNLSVSGQESVNSGRLATISLGSTCCVGVGYSMVAAHQTVLTQLR